MQMEDYCCFLGAYKLILSSEWREENVRIRRELAEKEYSHLSEAERKPRFLDDVWSEYLALVPRLANIVCQVPFLKTYDPHERLTAATELEKELRDFDEVIRQFFQSTRVVELLEPTEPPASAPESHLDCCPPPPFVPFATKYPQACVLRIVSFSVEVYIRTVLWPPLREAQNLSGVPFDDKAGYYATEVCRTFAGYEHQLDDNPDGLIPLMTAMVLATTQCPPKYRVWLWYKLKHFEKMGHLAFDPVLRNVATLWNMPHLSMDESAATPVEDPETGAECEELTSTIGKVRLDEKSADEHLKPVIKARGLYGLLDDP
jgi:hypothetical protein